MPAAGLNSKRGRALSHAKIDDLRIKLPIPRDLSTVPGYTPCFNRAGAAPLARYRFAYSMPQADRLDSGAHLDNFRDVVPQHVFDAHFQRRR